VLSQLSPLPASTSRAFPSAGRLRWSSSSASPAWLAVFTALLAMATGFESTLKATGRSDAVIVMRGGSNAELNSGLDRGQTDLIEQAPGIRAGADGKPLASAEMMIIAELIRRDDVKNGANITCVASNRPRSPCARS